jgi:CBS domain-containing protein
MRVAELMTKSVQTVAPQMAAADAWELMRMKRIHHLVVMADREVKGVLSDRDVGGRGGASVRANATVGDLMTTAVLTVEPDTTIRKVASVMKGRTIGCVPVVERGRLVGIVTVSDLLALLGRGIERPSGADRHELRYRVPHRKHKGSLTRAW